MKQNDVSKEGNTDWDKWDKEGVLFDTGSKFPQTRQKPMQTPKITLNVQNQSPTTTANYYSTTTTNLGRLLLLKEWASEGVVLLHVHLRDHDGKHPSPRTVVVKVYRHQLGWDKDRQSIQRDSKERC